MTEEQKLARLKDVRDWLRAQGCCYWCALGMAIAVVEHEIGEPPYRWKEVRGECNEHKAHPNATIGQPAPTCEERARAAWNELRQQRKVAA